MERGEVEGRGGECARLEAEPSPELYLLRASLALARHELQPGGLGCSGRAQKSREQRPRVRAGGEITGAAPHPLACQLQEPTKRDIRKGPDTDAETAPSLPEKAGGDLEKPPNLKAFGYRVTLRAVTAGRESQSTRRGGSRRMRFLSPHGLCVQISLILCLPS